MLRWEITVQKARRLNENPSWSSFSHGFVVANYFESPNGKLVLHLIGHRFSGPIPISHCYCVALSRVPWRKRADATQLTLICQHWQSMTVHMLVLNIHGLSPYPQDILCLGQVPDHGTSIIQKAGIAGQLPNNKNNSISINPWAIYEQIKPNSSKLGLQTNNKNVIKTSMVFSPTEGQCFGAPVPQQLPGSGRTLRRPGGAALAAGAPVGSWWRPFLGEKMLEKGGKHKECVKDLVFGRHVNFWSFWFNMFRLI